MNPSNFEFLALISVGFLGILATAYALRECYWSFRRWRWERQNRIDRARIRWVEAKAARIDWLSKNDSESEKGKKEYQWYVQAELGALLLLKAAKKRQSWSEEHAEGCLVREMDDTLVPNDPIDRKRD